MDLTGSLIDLSGGFGPGSRVRQKVRAAVAALPEAEEGWHRFPNADDDCGAVRLAAFRYLDEGLYRRIDVAGGTVYIYVGDLSSLNFGEDPNWDLQKMVKEYRKSTGASEKEVMVSEGSYYLAAHELVIYPHELWRSGVRGTLICASRSTAPRVLRSSCPGCSMCAGPSAESAAIPAAAAATSAAGSAAIKVARTSAAGSALMMTAAEVKEHVVQKRRASKGHRRQSRWPRSESRSRSPRRRPPTPSDSD